MKTVGIKVLSERTGLTTTQVQAVLLVIRHALIKGERVNLRSIGTLRTETRPAREFNVPHVGEVVFKPERRVVKFEVSRAMKASLSEEEP